MHRGWCSLRGGQKHVWCTKRAAEQKPPENGLRPTEDTAKLGARARRHRRSASTGNPENGARAPNSKEPDLMVRRLLGHPESGSRRAEPRPRMQHGILQDAALPRWNRAPDRPRRCEWTPEQHGARSAQPSQGPRRHAPSGDRPQRAKCGRHAHRQDPARSLINRNEPRGRRGTQQPAQRNRPPQRRGQTEVHQARGTRTGGECNARRECSSRSAGT